MNWTPSHNAPSVQRDGPGICCGDDDERAVTAGPADVVVGCGVVVCGSGAAVGGAVTTGSGIIGSGSGLVDDAGAKDVDDAAIVVDIRDGSTRWVEGASNFGVEPRAWPDEEHARSDDEQRRRGDRTTWDIAALRLATDGSENSVLRQ